jgi:acyl carrier protein
MTNTKYQLEEFIDNFQVAVDFQEPEYISGETILLELKQWDSLAALSIIVMFDLTYGKTIVGSDIENSRTMLDLFSLLD